ncbi:MAG: stalk domain-containing protein [Defluviitaleaceae bacterium]|nr:stalk domain-containing protein [Defluviitaleaceae bacterium]
MKNDNVPIGVAIFIFLVLGVLIAASIGFAGWNVLQLRIEASNAILALGKTVEVAPTALTSDIYVEEEIDENALTIEALGQTVDFLGHQPADVEYTTFVPILGVFEALGYIETWDANANRAIFTDGVNTVIITLDAETFTANGEPHELNIPAQRVDEVAMFPLREVVESVGYRVSFNEETNTISIEHRPAPTPEPTPEPEIVVARPRPTPTPEPEPEFATCQTCTGSGITTCHACNGIGGGRGTPLAPGIPYTLAPASDVWWCTVCQGHGTVNCRTCSGSGLVIVGS